MPLLKLIIHLMMVIFCTQIYAEDFSPASEDECYQSCDFDHEKNMQCLSNVAALNYVKTALFASIADTTKKVVEQIKSNSCTCARAKLEANGHFSSVEIIKTTDTNSSKVIQRALLETVMPPVPAAAACLLEKPQNPMPISVNGLP